MKIKKSRERTWDYLRSLEIQPGGLPDDQWFFVGMDFSRHDFRGCDFTNSTFEKCNMSKARMSGADLSSSAFFDAQLNGIDFSNASLNHADLSGNSMMGANLRGADFVCTDLCSVDLSESDLTGAVFREDGRMMLRCASINGACLRGATFDNVSFHGASVQYSDLVGVTLRRAKLKGVDFRCSDLREMTIEDCEISGCNFDGAIKDGFFEELLESFQPYEINHGESLRIKNTLDYVENKKKLQLLIRQLHKDKPEWKTLRDEPSKIYKNLETAIDISKQIRDFNEKCKELYTDEIGFGSRCRSQFLEQLDRNNARIDKLIGAKSEIAGYVGKISRIKENIREIKDINAILLSDNPPDKQYEECKKILTGYIGQIEEFEGDFSKKVDDLISMHFKSNEKRILLINAQEKWDANKKFLSDFHFKTMAKCIVASIVSAVLVTVIGVYLFKPVIATAPESELKSLVEKIQSVNIKMIKNDEKLSEEIQDLRVKLKYNSNENHNSIMNRLDKILPRDNAIE